MLKKGVYGVLAIALVLAIAFFIPLPAGAEGEVILDLSQGNITISDAVYSIDGNSGVNATNQYVIIQSQGGQTANTITVNAGVSAYILVSGIDINTPGCAFDIGSGADLTLNIDSETTNTLRSGADSAGIQIRDNAVLTIDGDDDTSGLNVYGGYWCAAIGSPENGSGGSLIINGGDILASGHYTSQDGAAIGNSCGGSFETITINGGNVAATTHDVSTYGIGGPRCGDIEINGGFVSAYGVWVPGINNGSGSNITITGGEVTASSNWTSGIKAGSGGTIEISGGKVTGSKGTYGVGIEPDGADLIISGGTVRANGGISGTDGGEVEELILDSGEVSSNTASINMNVTTGSGTPDAQGGTILLLDGQTSFTINGTVTGLFGLDLNDNEPGYNHPVITSSVSEYGDFESVDDTIVLTKTSDAAHSYWSLLPPAPVLESAETNSDGTKVILNFDKDMADPAGKHGGFSVSIDGTSGAPTGAALDSCNYDNIELTLSCPVTKNQTVTVSYSGNDIYSAEGGLLEAFSDEEVSNNAPILTWVTGINTIYEVFSGGEGSEASPYIIRNAADLAQLAYNVNQGRNYTGKFFILENNIDLSGREWMPIGKDYSYLFNGAFDGAGHSISGLTITEENGASYFGLFGASGNNATIKNLTIGSGEITFSEYPRGDSFGGIVGYNLGLISNCVNRLDINVDFEDTHAYVGGIAGYGAADFWNYSWAGRIEDCRNEGSISIGNHGCVGGIIGQQNGCIYYGYIRNCSNSGDITGGSYAEAGGIAGRFNNGQDIGVINCFNTGTVTSGSPGSYNAVAGGIVGYQYATRIINCYNTGDITFQSAGGNVDAGGISGYSYGYIINAYNVGTVSGSGSLGGIAGEGGYPYNFYNCYYLDTSALRAEGNGNPSGTASLTAEQMKGLASAEIAYDGATDGIIAGPSTSAFLLALNDGRYKIASTLSGYCPWASDDQNRNQGYPIFSDDEVYVVAFDSQNGSAVAAKTILHGGAISSSPVTSREGHKFEGWFKASTGGTPVVFPYTPAENVILFAQWTPVESNPNPGGGGSSGGGHRRRTPVTEVVTVTPEEVPSAPSLVMVLTIDSKKTMVNGQEVILEGAPYIKEGTGRTMVPLRLISEQLGAKVEWLKGTRQIRITYGDITIILTLGSNKVLVNGQEVEIECPPETNWGRTFVPLRFVSEILGATVEWDEATRQITITK